MSAPPSRSDTPASAASQKKDNISTKSSKKGLFSGLRKKSASPAPESDESSHDTFEDKEKLKKGGLKWLKAKSPEPKKGFGGLSLGFGKEKPPSEDGEEEKEPTPEEEAAEEGEGELEEVEEGNGFEDTMRDTLRTLGIEVEDDDDWKLMVIKTRLTLQALKDELLGKDGKSKAERTRIRKIVINEDNILEMRFRLDFAHYTPNPSGDELDSDELEIPPDFADLESPVGREPLDAQRERLKKKIKRIKKAEKQNKKRLVRLEEKRIIKAEEERIRQEELARIRAERDARKQLRVERRERIAEGEGTPEDEAEEEKYQERFQEREERKERRKAREEERLRKEKEKEEKEARKEKGEMESGDEETTVADDESEESVDDGDNFSDLSTDEEDVEEIPDDRTFIEKWEDDTGVKVSFNTELLEQRLYEKYGVVIKEYKDIFFGPDPTPEEIEEYEKIAADDKEFYIHWKFIVRKKTWQEKEDERIAKEEEERLQAEEDAIKAAIEKGEEPPEPILLNELDERKAVKRRELQKELTAKMEVEKEILRNEAPLYGPGSKRFAAQQSSSEEEIDYNDVPNVQ